MIFFNKRLNFSFLICLFLNIVLHLQKVFLRQ